MRRLLAATIFIALTLQEVRSQDMWLLPQKFFFDSGEKMIVDLMVGENFEGDFLDLNKLVISRATIQNRLGTTVLLDKIKKSRGKNVEYSLSNVGTYVLAVESDNARIEYSDQDFRQMADDGGFNFGEKGVKNTVLVTVRKSAKLLIQVGERTDDSFEKSAGHRFEISPLQNPYDLRSGDYLDCKVIYRGNAEPHLLVKVWSRFGNRIFLQNIYTENDGTIRFPISNQGEWMVSCSKLISSDQTDTDWEVFSASMVFEIK